jgi:hypothetical protein
VEQARTRADRAKNEHTTATANRASGHERTPRRCRGTRHALG